MRNQRFTKDTFVLLMAMSIMLLSCSTRPESQSAPLERDGGADRDLTVRVGMVDGPMLPGVQVLLVTSEGIRPYGLTDGLGVATISREDLSAPSTYAVLVCAEHFHCGALRLDDPRLQDLAERYIALAPFTIH